VTYQGHDDIDNAIKCVKKQIAIFEELKKTNTLQYVQCLTFVGEMYRDSEMTKEAITSLEKAIELHEALTKREGKH
jgi:tetratricopeptide (TPR) repeat protein